MLMCCENLSAPDLFILSIWRLNRAYAPRRPVCSGAIRPEAVMGDAGGLRVEQCGGVGEE